MSTLDSALSSNRVYFDSGKSYVIRSQAVAGNPAGKKDHLGRTEEDIRFVQQFEKIFLAAASGNLQGCQEVVREGFCDFSAVSVGRYGTNSATYLNNISPIKIANLREHSDIVDYLRQQKALQSGKKHVNLQEPTVVTATQMALQSGEKHDKLQEPTVVTTTGALSKLKLVGDQAFEQGKREFISIVQNSKEDVLTQLSYFLEEMNDFNRKRNMSTNPSFPGTLVYDFLSHKYNLHTGDAFHSKSLGSDNTIYRSHLLVAIRTLAIKIAPDDLDDLIEFFILSVAMLPAFNSVEQFKTEARVMDCDQALVRVRKLAREIESGEFPAAEVTRTTDSGSVKSKEEKRTQVIPGVIQEHFSNCKAGCMDKYKSLSDLGKKCLVQTVCNEYLKEKFKEILTNNRKAKWGVAQGLDEIPLNSQTLNLHVLIDGVFNIKPVPEKDLSEKEFSELIAQNVTAECDRNWRMLDMTEGKTVLQIWRHIAP